MAERNSESNAGENNLNQLRQIGERVINDEGNTLFVGLGPPQADFSAPPPYEASMDELQYQDSQRHLSSGTGILQPTPASLQPFPNPTANTVSNAMPPGSNLDHYTFLSGSPRHNYTTHQILPRPNRSVVSQRNIECNPNRQEFSEHSQCSKLPTYEEVQMQKSLTGELFSPIDIRFNRGFRAQRHYATLMAGENGRLLSDSMPSQPLSRNNYVVRQQSIQAQMVPSLLPASSASEGHQQHVVGQDAPSNIEDDSISNPEVNITGSSPLTFVSIDPTVNENLERGNTDYTLLGRDSIFATAFLAAFLFNWIGFLMITCFCNTVAARYGALSGFGLSLAKWTLIVKNSTELASYDNSWLWWLIMVFGLLICVRAIVQYVSIKRAWRVLSTTAQERLLFFY